MSRPSSGHGGARPGAGRRPGHGYKWGEPTHVMRIPQSRIEAVEAFLMRPADSPSRAPIPLFGHTIRAGFPSPADDYVEDVIDLHEHLIHHPAATFLLRVRGDSMIGAGIHDGDLLVVDRALDSSHGRVVIAVLDGELTVKRLWRSDGQIRLLAENPAYSPIEVGAEQELVIWGVVVHVIHSL